MVKAYALLIINKKKSFDEIKDKPAGIKKEIADYLESIGYDTNGDPLLVL